MANKIGKAKEATLQFFKTANPQDEFFLVSFNDRAELISAFTNSADDLQSRLLSASGKGRTALLDAIYLSLSEMHTARNNKRALLIISDGGDNNSRYNEKDIKRLVRRRILNCIRSAYLTRSGIGAVLQKNSMVPLCSMK